MRPLTVFADPARWFELGEGGTPLVLVHGFGGDLNNWLFNHEALAAGRRVIALDLPGHGESTKALQRGDLDELSESVLALARTARGMGHG